MICASKDGITHRTSEGDLREDIEKFPGAQVVLSFGFGAAEKGKTTTSRGKAVDQQLGDLEEILDSIGT